MEGPEKDAAIKSNGWRSLPVTTIGKKFRPLLPNTCRLRCLVASVASMRVHFGISVVLHSCDDKRRMISLILLSTLSFCRSFSLSSHFSPSVCLDTWATQVNTLIHSNHTFLFLFGVPLNVLYSHLVYDTKWDEFDNDGEKNAKHLNTHRHVMNQ